MAATLAPIALLGWSKARARRRLQSEGLGHAAHVLGAQTGPNPFFGGEGLVQVRLDPWVTPDDGPAYRTTTEVRTAQEVAGRFVPGANVVVRADPSSRGTIAVDMA